MMQKSRNLKCFNFMTLYERVGNPNKTLNHGSSGAQNGNKYDFLTFPTSPEYITSHLSFLLNYLNTLYLLEYVAPANNKLISRLLEHRDPGEFRVTTSLAMGNPQDHPRV